MPTSGAQRISEYRQRRREQGLPDTSRTNRKEHKRVWKKTQRLCERPFTGCDGEGAGTDEKGRQLYLLFRMGERELYTGSRLHTWDMLDFICSYPQGEILVGFAFGYDTTMILRDLPVTQQKRLFEPKTFGEGRSPWVWYKEFNVDYLPKQYLKVQRVKTVRDKEGRERRVPISGSTRIIWETFGFFQKSFLKALESFDIGTKGQRTSIAEQKARRSEFKTIGQVERDYCALECELLADLMEKLREYCYAAEIRPRSWNGAGKLASALHSLYNTPKSKDLVPVIPPGLADFANMAYYGGRFEITRVGEIKETVHEYDIRSAYPDAMRYLPCLEHGHWRFVEKFREEDATGVFVASCRFGPGKSGKPQPLGGLPVRSKEGHLYWPSQGAGIYWSPEIESARALGFDVRLANAWTFSAGCDCRPFDWVERLYDYRRSIGSAGPGYPIKLGINSLYGKLAQRKGNGAYNNMIWAGLITALTRASINYAIAENPSQIVMVATDAVYSIAPLGSLDCGDLLGQWEYTALDGLFIVQPGLYWCPERRKRKSRGLSGKFFEEPGLTEGFEDAWKYFAAKQNSSLVTDFPSVSVPVPGFIGLKLALARGKPEKAGTWVNDTRSISFDYRNKRQGHSWSNGHIITNIKPGYPGLVSLPHRDFLKAGGQEPWEAARLALDEQPDFVDFGIPFKD